LVLNWYGMVHIGIASGLWSLSSETWNEESRYGSSMALKTGQITTRFQTTPLQYRLSKETRPYSKRSSLSREIHPYSKRDATALQVYRWRLIHTPNRKYSNSQINNKLICNFKKSDYIQFAKSCIETTSCGFPATKSSPPPRKK